MTVIETQSALDAKIKTVTNVLRRSNCAGPTQYIPEITWLLFLRFLDEREEQEEAEAQVLGTTYEPSLAEPYRWRDWAAPDGMKRHALQYGSMGDVFRFLENDLLAYLHTVGMTSDASPRQRLISQIVSGVNETRVDTEHNFLDVLDHLDGIRLGSIDDQHLFALSAAYESLLPALGEKIRDGGQFFTPREAVRAMVRVVEPQIGETVFDPCCGTGGFLAESYGFMRDQLGHESSAMDLEKLAVDTFYGREKDNIFYPIALANLLLHGIEQPRIWHGNTLTGTAEYAALFEGAPPQYDVILTNPPFGGNEGIEAQTRYDYRTSSTQVLFLQEVIDNLAPNGRAGFVVDEGLLFRTTERAFIQTKRKLLDECDVYCIVSLAPGVFTSVGTGNKTNMIFFNKGKSTERIWYYELTPPDRERFTKTAPLTLDHFKEFFELLPERADSERSWTVSREEIEERGYDLKAVNPHRPDDSDTRTPEELLEEIARHGAELDKALAELRDALSS